MTKKIKSISERLKIARIASGYDTAKQFAEKYTIPTSTYCQHETGKRSLNIESLFFYAELLKIEPSWLLTGEGNPCDEFESAEKEQQILDGQEKLDRSENIKPAPTLSSNKTFSLINVLIFKKILVELLPLLKKIPNSQSEEVISFCFDLYNKIIATNAGDNERSSLIRISLESFFNGLGMRVTDEFLNKVADTG